MNDLYTLFQIPTVNLLQQKSMMLLGENEVLKEEIERLEKEIEQLRSKNYDLNELVTKADQILNFSNCVEEYTNDEIPY